MPRQVASARTRAGSDSGFARKSPPEPGPDGAYELLLTAGQTAAGITAIVPVARTLRQLTAEA